MAEEHLETCGHREVAETVEQCFSDWLPQQQLTIGAPPAARWEGEFTGSSGGKLNCRTAHSADLFVLTGSRSRVTEPNQVVKERVDFMAHPYQSHIGHHFVC